MLTVDNSSIRPVYEHMVEPEVFFGFVDVDEKDDSDCISVTGSIYGFDIPDKCAQKKISCLEMALFLRGGNNKDFSLMRHTLTDVATGGVEVVPVPEVVQLPNVDKGVLKNIFREAFEDRCVDYDDVDLISEALSQNCVAQMQSSRSDAFHGAFKMTVNRTITPSGVTDFSFSLSALRSQLKGLEVLEGKCDVQHTVSRLGNKHKVVIKPKRLRRPTVTYACEDMEKEVKDVLDRDGSLMIPEYGFRRGVIIDELLRRLKLKQPVIDRLSNSLDKAIIGLEQSGYAFRGKGVIAYVAKGEARGDPSTVCLVVKPISCERAGSPKLQDSLRSAFVSEFNRADPSLVYSHLLKIGVFEAESFYFGDHAAIELSVPN